MPAAEVVDGHPTAGTGFGAFGIFLGVQFALGVAAALFSVGSDVDLDLASLILVGLASQVVAWFAVRALLRRKLAPGTSITGPGRFRWRHVAAGIGVGAVAPFAVGAVVVALQSLLGLDDPEPVGLLAEVEQASTVTNVVIFVSVVLAAPAVEELVFRRALFGGIRRRLGLAWGLALSSLLFGLVHLDVILSSPVGALQGLGLVLVGLVLALLHHRTDHLAAPIAAHATYNGVIMALTFAAA